MLSGFRYVTATLLVLTACRAQSGEVRAVVPAPRPPAAEDLFEGYRIDRPDTVLSLPHALDEVSGLTWGPDGLEANYDERGDAYRLVGDQWERRRSYAGKGDFEGIAYAGSAFYALRSDGWLVTPEGMVDLKAPRGCDGEGLAYDARGGRMLVACKGKSSATRVVLAWDLASRRLMPQPVLSIATNLGRTESRLARLFHLDRLDRFKPSGVEVAPDGRLFVLSSQTQAVAVFSRAGVLEAAAGLDARILPQPEGITFGPDETLYIASEAAGRAHATLAVFHKVRAAPNPP